MSKYGVISGPYFPVFGLNTASYGPEISPCLDTFHAVEVVEFFVTSSEIIQRFLWVTSNVFDKYIR